MSEPLTSLRRWHRDEAAPRDATGPELLLHTLLWGGVFVEVPLTHNHGRPALDTNCTACPGIVRHTVVNGQVETSHVGACQ